MRALTLFLLIAGLSAATSLTAQDTEAELFETLRQYDSLLFDQGYYHCDTATLRQIISDDLEFYHDLGGLMTDKEAFLQGMAGMCHMSYKPRRALDAGTLQVFPLYQQGKLYGAVQTGEHRFLALEEGKPEYLTSTARFTHVWMLQEDGHWLLSRVLSYDHQVPEESGQ